MNFSQLILFSGDIFLSMGHFELSCFGDGFFREHMTSLDLTVKTTGD